MTRTVRIKAADVEVTAELNSSRTAGAIWKALPVEGRVNLWGDEIYFPVPVHLGPEEGKELVNIGDLGYWPVGAAFCIFFGPTPVSRGEEIRPASPVNVFGRIIGDAKVFRQVPEGSKIVIERASAG